MKQDRGLRERSRQKNIYWALGPTFKYLKKKNQWAMPEKAAETEREISNLAHRKLSKWRSKAINNMEWGKGQKNVFK